MCVDVWVYLSGEEEEPADGLVHQVTDALQPFTNIHIESGSAGEVFTLHKTH